MTPLKKRIKDKKLRAVDVAAFCDINPTTLRECLSGARMISVRVSICMDDLFGIEEGTTYLEMKKWHKNKAIEGVKNAS